MKQIDKNLLEMLIKIIKNDKITIKIACPSYNIRLVKILQNSTNLSHFPCSFNIVRLNICKLHRENKIQDFVKVLKHMFLNLWTTLKAGSIMVYEQMTIGLLS